MEIQFYYFEEYPSCFSKRLDMSIFPPAVGIWVHLFFQINFLSVWYTYLKYVHMYREHIKSILWFGKYWYFNGISPLNLWIGYFLVFYFLGPLMLILRGNHINLHRLTLLTAFYYYQFYYLKEWFIFFLVYVFYLFC